MEKQCIFAGPFTVTHHKSTLLIAGMFSFMNAVQDLTRVIICISWQSVRSIGRGAKTLRIHISFALHVFGAFSLVMGRHVNHPDTSDLPFSYLIEDKNTTYLVAGVNLRSVGTIRDGRKWQNVICVKIFPSRSD